MVNFLNSYQGKVDFLLGIKDLFVLKWKFMGKTEPWKPPEVCVIEEDKEAGQKSLVIFLDSINCQESGQSGNDS